MAGSMLFLGFLGTLGTFEFGIQKVQDRGWFRMSSRIVDMLRLQRLLDMRKTIKKVPGGGAPHPFLTLR